MLNEDLRNDKRGIAPMIILLSLGLIAVAVIVGFLVFSGTARFIVLGIGLLVGGFFIVRDRTRSGKKFSRPVIIILVTLGGVGIFFILGAGILEVQAPQPYFEAPVFGTVQCLPASERIVSDRLPVSVSGRVLACPSNAEDCDITVSYPAYSKTFAERVNVFVFGLTESRWAEWEVCTKGGTGCTGVKRGAISTSGVTNQKIVSNLRLDQDVFLTFNRVSGVGSTTRLSEGSSKITFVPFVLWKSDVLRGGLNQISGSTDCRLRNEDFVLNGVISNQLGTTPERSFDISKDFLRPNEAYNFISGTVTRATFGNTVTFQGQPAYCLETNVGAQIVGLADVETPIKTYTVVNTDNVLANVQCCVVGQIILDQVCKADFTLEKIQTKQTTDPDTGETIIETGVECSLLNQCNPGKFVLNEVDKTSFEFDCVLGQCVASQIQTEECVQTSDCSTNEICSNFKCEIASTVTIGEKGDEVELTTKEECETRADDQPFLGWTFVETTTEIGRGPLGIGSIFGLTKTEVSGECKAQFLPLYLWGGLVIFLAIMAILLLKKPKKPKSRRRRRRIPITK